jgi:hypothetical protein
LFKSVLVRERVSVQFRAQTFNTVNTPLFAGPHTAYGSANFGTITAQANSRAISSLDCTSHTNAAWTLSSLLRPPAAERAVFLRYVAKGPGNVESHTPLAH